jgi:hypothetical protein
MWEVNSGKATVYLLGSIHLANEEIYPLDTVITNSFERSDYLGLEIDMSNPDVSIVMKKAYYQNGETMKQHLRDSTYQLLVKEFAKYKITEPFYQKMKPWFGVMTLQSLEMMKGGFSSDNGIDMHFLNLAKEKKKGVVELETADFQMNMLDSVLTGMQDDFVLFSMKDFDSTNSQVDDLFKYWQNGDVEAFEKFTTEEYAKMPNSDAFEKAFVTDRNIHMANKIKEYLETNKSYFIVVGAAHLVGNQGVVKLLENEKKYIINQK